jgi:polyphosphate kinase
VELLFPILNSSLVRRLRDKVIKTCLSDNCKARMGRPDGTYEFAPVDGEKAFDSQSWFLRNDDAESISQAESLAPQGLTRLRPYGAGYRRPA